MNTLQQQYNTLNKIYIRLDNLIRTSLFKAVKVADEWLELQKNSSTMLVETKATRFNENECDRIAYNDAINRRFERYYQLTCSFLHLYLKEKFAVSSSNPELIFKGCLNHALITDDEYKELMLIRDYADAIKDPYNSEGDYECSEELLVYTVVMNDILLKLNPATASYRHLTVQ